MHAISLPKDCSCLGAGLWRCCRIRWSRALWRMLLRCCSASLVHLPLSSLLSLSQRPGQQPHWHRYCPPCMPTSVQLVHHAAPGIPALLPAYVCTVLPHASLHEYQPMWAPCCPMHAYIGTSLRVHHTTTCSPTLVPAYVCTILPHAAQRWD